MLCLRRSRGFSAMSAQLVLPRDVVKSAFAASYSRTFTSLRGPLRPTVFSSFRPSAAISVPTSTTISAAGENLDLLPKISTHPALGATQIRCGPRNTFNPSHFVRKRRHGFLSRIRTRKGRATLLRRKLKKRTTLSH